MGSLEGKVALVSGAARGIGAAIAQLLASEGASVLLGDVRDDLGIDQARSIGEAAVYRHLDVRRPDDWQGAVSEAVSDFGKLDILVNNAAIVAYGLIEDFSEEDFIAVFEVNQLGCFLGMKAVVGAMERSGGGSIVNISSGAGLRGSPQAFAYSTTKWALRGMTKAAAMDLARHKIRVNSIHPGPIETEMLKEWTGDQREKRLKSVPMRRTGSVDEVAQAVLFLLSDEASYITGAEVAVDGGVTV